MAVVTKRAASLSDPQSAKPKQEDVRQHHGVLRRQLHQADIGNGDSAGSTVEIARIPSHALLSRQSRITTAGVAGLTDADLGFSSDPDALADGAALAAAADLPALSAVASGDEKKRVWQLAGLEKDPKADISVFLTLNTAATASGSVLAELIYVMD